MGDNSVLVVQAATGVLLLMTGFWFNRKLESFKGELERKLQRSEQVALARLPAYLKLWAHMEIVSPTATRELAGEERKELDDQLRSWYYKEGNGIFLSLDAARLCLEGRSYLTDPAKTSQEIRKAFSRLRTQMKTDIAVYGPVDAETEIGIS